jgi:acyl-homoserine-lactone acylase
MIRMTTAALAAAAAAALVAGCAGPAGPTVAASAGDSRTATIQRTANGVAHIAAPDFETLAYGVAWAHAQDNVCQTANQLVTARGQRARHFGGAALGLLGRRMIANEQIDLFVTAQMDDAALARAWSAASADAQALARGYVAGYNRYLADHTGKLPAACNHQPWVLPMTLAEYFRMGEILTLQAGLVAFADAMVAARPPAAKAAGAASPAKAAGAASPAKAAGAASPAKAARLSAPVTLAEADAAAREMGLSADAPLGSNAWAFGKDTTGGAGLLLGNPHFPWAGANRFWQMHLTVPGRLDVMGASTGNVAIVQIGFNKDVAWSHTVSTGKRFTLHELALVPGDPTSHLVDGQPEKMRSKTVSVMVRGADGLFTTRQQTFWFTRFGPVIAAPRLGLAWSAERAYALQDVNVGNTRALDAWIAFAGAKNVKELHAAHATLGMPFVNTIAADRHGQAMYADVSTVPDVDAAMFTSCAPGAQAAALRTGAAGIVVLDGSKSACNWKRDAASPVPGLIPIGRMPVAMRADWVHNSNDSFFYTHPAQRFEGISPMVGDDVVRRPRTRSELIEIPELVARGPVTPAAAQAQLLANRNLMARVALPDLLAACANTAAGAPTPEARDGCAALRGWDRNNNLESRGAHLFREFWRAAAAVPGVYRLSFDKAQPVATPAGLKMDDAAVAAKVWEALAAAVKKVRDAGHPLDAPLGTVQVPLIAAERIALHGGEEIEGVLNNLGNQFSPGIAREGLRIDYGTSYVQTVTFDARGPLAEALLTYGQSSDPASPHATDQMKLFSAKRWPRLPFHAEDVARERVGEALRLTRP